MPKVAVRNRPEVATAAHRVTPVEALECRRLFSWMSINLPGPSYDLVTHPFLIAPELATPVTDLAPAADGELGTLVPTLLASFPPTALAGGKVKGASATVTITNVADTTYNGPVTVTLFTSTDATLDTAVDATITAVTKKVRIDSAQSAAVQLKIKSFPNVPDGDYLVIAQVSSPTVASGINSTDETIRISAPFTDLAGSVAPIPTTPVTKGKKARLSLTVNNAGNVDAKGTVPVTVAVSTEGGPVTLATVNAKLAVKPGASKPVKLNFTVPTDAPSGTFFVNATLGALPTETNTANNTILSDTTLTIA